MEDLPLVTVGDVLKLRVPASASSSSSSTGGEEKWKRVEATVLSVKKDKKNRWKYKLQVGDGVIKGDLSDLDWKLSKSKSKKRSREEESTEQQLTIPKILKVSKLQGSMLTNAIKYILAPMVNASELAFRLLCRRYGATLAYTPMINSEKFAVDPEYRKVEFQTTPEDRPLVAHFAANNPEFFLQAVRHVEKQCDAIDLNLGCPQRVAFAGHYGSFLLEEVDRPLVLSLIRKIAENSIVPIFAKIRLLDTVEDTIRLCQQLIEAGVSLIAIHARYRVNLVNRTGPGARDGLAHLDQVKVIRETVDSSIPIIANGNIRNWDDVQANLALTKAEGVMSAEGILDNPALYHAGTPVPPLQLATEYLELVEKHPVKIKTVVFHIRRMCKDELTKYQLMEKCMVATDVQTVREIVQEMVSYDINQNYQFDPKRAKAEKEAIERRKREEGKRKDYEARMMRKAKREGKESNHYLLQGMEAPTSETIDQLKAMPKEEAFEYWKQHHGQHCWAFHFHPQGCERDRKCAFLHSDSKLVEAVAYG